MFSPQLIRFVYFARLRRSQIHAPEGSETFMFEFQAMPHESHG